MEGKPRPYEDKLSDEGVIRYRLGVRDSESRFPPSQTVALLDPSPPRPPQSGAHGAALQGVPIGPLPSSSAYTSKAFANVPLKPIDKVAPSVDYTTPNFSRQHTSCRTAIPKGEPWVSNGLALCKLHHGAFDSYILGVRPDLVIEIRKDVLDESDGPMLMHGLQECHNARLAVEPIANRLTRNKGFLEERYELFRKAG